MSEVSGQGLQMPGETKLSKCCRINHDLKALAGDASGPNKGEIAGPDVSSPCDVGTVNYISASWAAYCTIDAIYTITDWVFWIVLVLAVLMFVIGGGMFVAAAGDPERAAKGKKVIIYGIIGLVIALLAKLIPAVARFLVGV